jgi:hypothetical protein
MRELGRLTLPLRQITFRVREIGAVKGTDGHWRGFCLADLVVDGNLDGMARS